MHVAAPALTSTPPPTPFRACTTQADKSSSGAITYADLSDAIRARRTELSPEARRVLTALSFAWSVSERAPTPSGAPTRAPALSGAMHAASGGEMAGGGGGSNGSTVAAHAAAEAAAAAVSSIPNLDTTPFSAHSSEELRSAMQQRLKSAGVAPYLLWRALTATSHALAARHTLAAASHARADASHARAAASHVPPHATSNQMNAGAHQHSGSSHVQHGGSTNQHGSSSHTDLGSTHGSTHGGNSTSTHGGNSASRKGLSLTNLSATLHSLLGFEGDDAAVDAAFACMDDDCNGQVCASPVTSALVRPSTTFYNLLRPSPAFSPACRFCISPRVSPPLATTFHSPYQHLC